jgi:hypothetical protein
MQLVGREKGILFALVTALLAALVVGCGGSSSDAAPLKKSQFVKQADEVCASAQKERADQRGELTESEDAGGELMQTLLEPVETMTDDLAELGPPVGQEKEVEAIIAAYQQGISKLEAEPNAPDASTAFDKANEMAEGYGLSDCVI